MNRRFFVGGLSALGVSAALARKTQAAATAPGRTVVLIQLQGGNDGLNTVIPASDPEYKKLRPRLAIDGVPFAKETSRHPALHLHPSLAPLAALETEVVLGVGYEDPVRSHFRSQEIWELASKRPLDEGWTARATKSLKGNELDALIVGQGELGAFLGNERMMVLRHPRQLNQVRTRKTLDPGRASSPALAHILEVEARRAASEEVVRKRLRGAARATFTKRTPFHRAMETAARAIAGGLRVPFIHVTLKGFDTHKDQKRKHAALLEDLAVGIADLRKHLVAHGAWERTMVMTYSEFGRRAAENASGGTDHGTAAPHFVLGGAVKRAVVGDHPSLTKLDRGDLIFTRDFKAHYARATAFLATC